MRFSQLLWGALALCLGCGNSGGGGGTTEVPPPPPSLNVSLVGSTSVVDSAVFTLHSNGGTGRQFVVTMGTSSVIYQGTDSVFMWHPPLEVFGTQTLTPSVTYQGKSAGGMALTVTVTHPITIRFARSRYSQVFRQQCGNSTWVRDDSKFALGLFLATSDTVAGTQTCQLLGDSAYVGQLYNVSSALWTFHKDEVVKFTASLSAEGLCLNLSDAQFVLQRTDSATGGAKQIASFTWDELHARKDTITLAASMGQVGTSSGYNIYPVVILKHKCKIIDESKVLISNLKLIYIPAVKVDTIKVFTTDSMTITSSRR